MDWDIIKERIKKVIDDVEHDEIKLYEVWSKHILDKISFPFEAEVAETQRRGDFFKVGDKLKVKKIECTEHSYGIIVEVRFGRLKRHIPLAYIKPLDLEEEEKQVLYDYRVWFADKDSYNELGFRGCS